MPTTVAPQPLAIEPARSSRGVTLLLAGGIAYGITYAVFNDLIAARIYAGYSSVDQTISELSAVGAPSRPFLVIAGVIWPLLLAGFGVGVWRTATCGAVDHPGVLRLAGGVLVAHGVLSSLWLLFPMSRREDIVAGTTASNDVGHLVMAAGTVLFIVCEVALGAAALGWRFRIYSILSALTILVFGALTSAQVSNIAEGRPTPLVGVYERIDVGAWLLWLGVLALALLGRVNRRGTASRGSKSSSPPVDEDPELDPVETTMIVSTSAEGSACLVAHRPLGSQREPTEAVRPIGHLLRTLSG